jgi:hypothetical protein
VKHAVPDGLVLAFYPEAEMTNLLARNS